MFTTFDKLFVSFLLLFMLYGCAQDTRPCIDTTEVGTFISQEVSGTDYKIDTTKGTYYIWTKFNGVNKGDRVWIQDRRMNSEGICSGHIQYHLCMNTYKEQCYWTQ